MGKVFKRRGSRFYQCKYKDENGKVCRPSLGVTDKLVAEQKFAKIIRDVERRKCGLIDTFTDAAQQPIAELLAEYRQYLDSKGSTANHVQRTIQKIQDILDGKGMKKPKVIRRISDLEPSTIAAWLTNKRKDVGHATSNNYLTAIKGFSYWLQTAGKTPNHRLISLTPLNPDVDRRHLRRSLPNAEFQRLLSITKISQDTFQGVDGLTRWRLYLVASLTGLRASECLSLSVKQFNFELGRFSIQAKNTKAKKSAELGLNEELQQELQAWIAAENLQPNDKLFNVSKWLRTADLLKSDLKAAGIPYDVDGELFDFHAIRGQFCTMLDRAGVAVIQNQKMMRHSTPTLTAKYCRPDIADLESAVNKLRVFTEPNESAQAKPSKETHQLKIG